MLILIVSPVVPVRQSLRVLFEQERHKVLLAESLDGAIEIMSQHLTIDVVISEWKLNKGTGFELKRRAQQIDRVIDSGIQAHSQNFVILATPPHGSGLSESRSLCQEIQAFGFEDVFEKPIDRAGLCRRIAEIGRERSSAVIPVPGASGTSQSATRSAKVKTLSPASAIAAEPPHDVELARLSIEVHDLHEQLEVQSLRLKEIERTIELDG